MTGRDGELDERVLMAFEAALETLPPSSVIIGTAATRRNIFPKLSRLFVQDFELGSLNREDRENLSRRIADERNIKVENEHLHRYVAGRCAILFCLKSNPPMPWWNCRSIMQPSHAIVEL